MKQLKFLHCSDVHFDTPFTSFGLDFDKRTRRKDDIKRTFEKIIDIAKNQDVDVFLISGDLFEHEYVKKSTINFINEKFKEIPKTQVFMIAGNHDPLVRNSYYDNFDWNDNVHVLSDDRKFFHLSHMGVCVYGVGFNDFIQSKSSIDILDRAEDGLINILLVHGTVDMPFYNGNYNPMTSSALESLNMDYIALGHFHNRIEGLGKKKIIYNPGSPEPLGFDEEGEHGVFVGTLQKSGMNKTELKVEFIGVNEKTYIDLDVRVDNALCDEQVTDIVIDKTKKLQNQENVVCITLTGCIDPEYKVDVSKIQSNIKDKFFFVKVKDETALNYDFEGIMADSGLMGTFVKKMFELINNADKNEEKLLTKALYYGIQALRGGKIDIY